MRRLTFGGKNRAPIWSPDGQWVLFQSDREGDLAVFRPRAEPVPGSSGNPPVFLQPFPATGAKYLVRQLGGHPYWSPKGDQLILNVRAGQSVIVPVTTTPTVAFGQEVDFPRTGRTEGPPESVRRTVDSHPDGEHIVGITNVGAGQGTSRQITVVLNWFDELRARVPAP